MISQTAEYALRAVVYLASQDDSRTTPQIAEATRVPVGYLSKVLQKLTQARLLRSLRGQHGGFALARSAERLTVYDVIQAVDPLRRIRSCPLGIKGHISLCPLHRRLDGAIALVEEALQASTVADLLTEPSAKRGVPVPLCS